MPSYEDFEINLSKTRHRIFVFTTPRIRDLAKIAICTAEQAKHTKLNIHTVLVPIPSGDTGQEFITNMPVQGWQVSNKLGLYYGVLKDNFSVTGSHR